MGLLLLQGSAALNPRELFANGEQGLWLDPSQMSTVYQDSNGVTPCTAAGDPVGLIIDQSRGGLGALGPELVPGTYTGTVSGTWAIGSTSITRNSSSTGQVSFTLSEALSTAKRYRLQFTVSNLSGDTFGFRLGGAGAAVQVSSNGVYTAHMLPTGSNANIVFIPWGGSAGEATITNISIREVPGNHAYQTTSASRPTLARIPSSGRRNLLTYSEDLSNAAWVNNGGTVTSNSTIAPDGTTTADTLTRSTAATEGRYQAVAFTGDGAKAVSVYVKAGTAPSLGVWLFDSTATVNRMLAAVDMTGATPIVTLTAGASSAVENVGSGWFRLTFVSTSVTAANTNRLYLMPAYGGASANGQTSIFWGAMAENAATATNYQKVVATTDVTESGFGDFWHLVFDGSDDSLVTNSVDFSGTDEMTVIAGVRYLVNSAYSILCEFSADWSGNNGTFILSPSDGGNNYYVGSRGNVSVNISPSASAPPRTNVVTLTADISSDLLSLRSNAIELSSSSSNQGSGNYGNHQLFIGRRNQASLPLNGHIYQLIIRGKTTPTGKLLEAERFVGRKTGVSF